MISTLKPIIKKFKNGNVSVVGMRGTGKDVLFGNVISRRSKIYVSNVDYTLDDNFKSYVYSNFDCDMTYKDLIKGNIKYYCYPYKDGTDLYLSDSGIYFPSQYNGELNKEFKSLPVFMALSRHLGQCNVHTNSQNLNRVWDKIREQSDEYILCRKCIFILGFVFQWVYVYDRAESCQKRIKPCQYTIPLFANREMKQRAKLYFDNFENQNGSIKSYLLIYRNKSKHDTYSFKDKFLNGARENEKENT